MSKFFLLVSLVVASTNGYCEKVVMVFGQSLSPYIIEENHGGAELLIIKESLALEGHELVPVYTALERVGLMFEQGKVDAAHRYLAKDNDEQSFFYGEVTLEYHDVFFTLDERNITIEAPEDLKNYSLLSFQGAHKHYPRWLPEGYEHSQTSAQIAQVKLLQLGLTDIVLSDRHIFNHNSRLYRQTSEGELKKMRMHIFTSPYKYNPVFKSKEVAKAFSTGLQKLKTSGRYKEIMAKFIKEDLAIANESTSYIDETRY